MNKPNTLANLGLSDKLLTGCSTGSLQDVIEAVEAGADIKESIFALSVAAEKNHLDIVIYLCEHGADFTLNLSRPFRHAVDHGHYKIVKYFVEKGADIHLQNGEQLLWACGYGYMEIVQCFVEHGINVHIQNDKALITAAENSHLNIVQYLIMTGNMNPQIIVEQKNIPTIITDWVEQYIQLQTLKDNLENNLSPNGFNQTRLKV